MAKTQPQPVTSDVPNTESVASLPKEDRKSFAEMARFFWDQYTKGISLRADHDKDWIKVKSILSNVHYFRISGGVYRKIPRKPGDTHRAKVPIMVPAYRRELGRIGSNVPGVSATPKTAAGKDAFYISERAQAILDHWISEARIPEAEELANQHLAVYGTSFYHWYVDDFERQVKVKSLPGPNVLPVPFDAKTFEEADGVMYVRAVTKQWLELQDALQEQKLGHGDFDKMAEQADGVRSGMTVGSSAIGDIGIDSRRQDGATGITIWMKPSPIRPHGEIVFMVNDFIHRYFGQPDQENGRVPFPTGKIPIEPSYYIKTPHDWWGLGFCEQLTGQQLEANRQLSVKIKNARFNKPFILADPQMLDAKNVQLEDDLIIPLSQAMYDGNKNSIIHVPAPRSTSDTNSVLDVVLSLSDRAAGHDSPVTRGVQSGRTEGGPATQALINQAEAPLRPMLAAKFRAWERIFPEALDLLKPLWPQEKTLQVVGEHNLGKEIMVGQNDVPTSQDVILKPNAFLPQGRGQLFSILLQMMQLPGPDGKPGSLVSPQEFKKSLRMLELTPPGLDTVDEAEQRIQCRIGMLVNDGKQPAIAPYGSPGTEHMVIEDHPLAMELLRKKILHPSFNLYGQPVRQALLAELYQHAKAINPVQSDQFDDRITSTDARQAESIFDAIEQDQESIDGIMTNQGIPVGV